MNDMMTDNDSAAAGQAAANHHPSNQIGAPLRDAAPPVGSPAPEGIEGQGEAPAAGQDGPGEVAAWPQAVPGVRPAVPLERQAPEQAKLKPGKESNPAASGRDDSAPDYSKLAMPEGYAADDPKMAEALALLGEHRLPTDAVQKLVDFAARRDKAVVEAHAQAHAEADAKANADAWAGVIRGWQAALRADLAGSTEFTGAALGGDGLKEMQSLAARAIDAYGGEDAATIREHLQAYALGDHPAFARFLARAGRSVREDTMPRPNDGGGRLSTAQVLYGNIPGKE
jgi:hypothetical protein